MRTIKELLQLMLDNPQLFDRGLCFWTNGLYGAGLIGLYELDELDDYIAKNRPSMFSSIDAYLRSNTGYYWKCGRIKPRIKWLKKHIVKN